MSRQLSELSKSFSPVTLALSASQSLTEQEREILENAQTVCQTVTDGQYIIRTGDIIDRCIIVRSGWLARQRSSADGQMVTTNVYLPGDVLSVHLGFERTSQFDLVALQNSEVAIMDRTRLEHLSSRSRTVSAALDWSGVRAFNILSERVVSLSTRAATESVLHLLLELWCRLLVVGQASADQYAIPLSQKEVGEMVGISMVSANRSIQTLRKAKLITFESGRVEFNDVQGCMEFCDFNTDYLETFTPVGSAELDFYTSKRS